MFILLSDRRYIGCQQGLGRRIAHTMISMDIIIPGRNNRIMTHVFGQISIPPSGAIILIYLPFPPFTCPLDATL